MKNLNTQMASLATLKHDSLLYVKPARATFCGCDFPKGYVEPKIAFWEALLSMAQITAKMIEPVEFSNASFEKEGSYREEKTTLSSLKKSVIQFLQRFAEITEELLFIVKKQMSRELLTLEESYFLRSAVESQVGGSGIGSYSGWYYEMFYPERYAGVKSDVIVSDVHTNYPDLTTGDPGSVLHFGIGETDTIAMVVENVGAAETGKIPSGKPKDRGGFGQAVEPPTQLPPKVKSTDSSKADKVCVFYGPVFSFYEFETKVNERLTDAEWGSMVDSPNIPARPTWSNSFLVHTPVKALPTSSGW